MPLLFPEERQTQRKLLEEWTASIEHFTALMDAVQGQKGEVRDQEALLWQRLDYPKGIVQVIRQKVLRLDPIVANYALGVSTSMNGDDLIEELRDIANYCRMLGAITMMLERREQDEIRASTAS